MKIERKIPMPKSGGGRKIKYPILEMKIGDSLFFPLTEKYKNDLAKYQRIVSAMVNTRLKQKNLDWRISTRMDFNENGIRVWRTK